MKIKTYEQLFDRLNDEIAWRRKELIDLKSLIETKSFTPSKHHALVRSGVMLLYAHWEGFVKQCAEYYLNYVSMRRLPHNQLTENFIAMCIKSELYNLSESNKIENHLKIINFFFEEMSKQSSLPYKNMVHTESNLSSIVLKNIILSLGFEYDFYESKSVMLDERLLGMRNGIAHGNYMPLVADDYISMHKDILELMEYFFTQIDNAVATEAFKRV